MNQSTHDVRRANWLKTITECQQRPVNVSVKQWLADNGIKEKAYYYWLRKFRREAFEQIQLPVAAEGNDFFLQHGGISIRGDEKGIPILKRVYSALDQNEKEIYEQISFNFG